jgi:FkbM family methyltransferase
MNPPLPLLQAPAEWRVKLRDKLAPRWRLRLRIDDGVLPYDSADLVASRLKKGEFEGSELSILLDLLPLCRGFIDVGANLGLYTLLASRRMRDGKVFAFEASTIEFEKLSWTVRENRLRNVTIVHRAMSDEEGEATIHESLFGAGALNRLDRPAKLTGAWRATRVRKTSLDQYLAGQGDIVVDLVKIDVEGHELPVLRGARDLFARKAPLLMIEVNPSRASEQSTPAGIFAEMHAQNYRWLAIDETAARLYPVEEPVDTINYFAIPRGRSDSLISALLARSPP